ncbi:Sulfite exporter TauE/SafE family protein 1, partial [Linum perenne]
VSSGSIVFLVWLTVKTCRRVHKWKSETEETNRRSGDKIGGDAGEPLSGWEEDCEWKGVGSSVDRFPWMKLGVLVMVWFSSL